MSRKHLFVVPVIATLFAFIGIVTTAPVSAAPGVWSVAFRCSDNLSKDLYYNNFDVKFRPGEFCLVSKENGYKAVFQTDGNLVVYKANTAIWHSATFGKTGANGYLSFQTDGNMVIYSGDGKALWQSQTYASNPTVQLPVKRLIVMQNDGNFVLYNGANQAVWSSWYGKTATDTNK